MSKTILGLDVGDVKVGVALARAGTGIAIPLASFERKASEAESKLLKIIREENIEIVVAGLPLDEDDKEGVQCEKIRNFCRRLEKRVSIELVFQDEYGTSDEAAAELRHIRGGRSSAKAKGALDAVAAAMILQQYLDDRKYSK